MIVHPADMSRIVSFLPSATEILYELGVGDQVLAVTHECNYPIEATSKPKVIHSSFDPQKMSSYEIDKKVVELVHTGKDIYVLDEKILKKANPDRKICATRKGDPKTPYHLEH